MPVSGTALCNARRRMRCLPTDEGIDTRSPNLRRKIAQKKKRADRHTLGPHAITILGLQTSLHVVADYDALMIFARLSDVHDCDTNAPSCAARSSKSSTSRLTVKPRDSSPVASMRIQRSSSNKRQIVRA